MTETTTESETSQTAAQSSAHKPGLASPPRTHSLWRDTDYAPWLVADTSVALSGSISGFAIPLIALSVTGSPAQASLVSAVESCVFAVTSIPGGVIQDRFDRRRLLLIWGFTGVVLFSLFSGLGEAGWLGIISMVVFSALMGLRLGLLGNTSNVMLRGIVPDDQLPTALSLNNGRDALINVIGQPLSGLLMGIGSMIPLFTSAVLNVIQLFGAWRIRRYWKRAESPDAVAESAVRHAQAKENTQPQHRPGWRDAFTGLVWIVSWPFQRRLVIGSLLLNGPLNAMLLITQLHVAQSTGSSFIAAMVVTVGSVGMLLGAAAASLIMNRIRGGVIISISFALLLFGSLGVAVAPNVWVKGAFLFVGIALLPASNAVVGGMFALLVSKENQGRLNAAMALCGMAGDAGFTAFAGLLMTWIGYERAALMLVALLTVGVVLDLSLKPLVTLPKPGGWGEHIERCQLHQF